MRIGRAITCLLTIVFLLLFTITGKAQSIGTQKVTIGLKDESLEAAVKKIEQQSAFIFFYRSADIAEINHLNLPQATRTVEQTLNLMLQKTPLSFRQMDNNILLERKDREPALQIKGRILNSADKKPIGNASVFLGNATIGCKTADDGTFALGNIKAGKYELVISIVGFETHEQAVTIDNSDLELPAVELSPKTIVLKEIKVKPGNDPEWDRHYQWFKDELLGPSALAAECKILNPEVLDLIYDYSTRKLTASASDFLEIENNALGYKIKYLLTSFSREDKGKQEEKIHFHGSAFFEEMKGTPADEARWEKKRKEIYENSMMHFLRAGLANIIEEEGFRVLRITNLPNPQRPADSVIKAKINFYQSQTSNDKKYRDTLAYWELKRGLPKTIQTLERIPLKQEEIIKLTDQKGLFALVNNNSSLYIIFNKKRHFTQNNKLSDVDDADNTSKTIIRFNASYVLFDRNGGVIDPNSASFAGAWGKNRFAEFLPVDYTPTASGDKLSHLQAESAGALMSPAMLKTNLLKIKSISDSIGIADASEKLYVQFDKPYYALGDTIWYKAYLANASSLFPADKSAIMYIDIANDSNKVVKRYSIPLANGLGWGNITLNETDFNAGTYTLHAYTNWMRNFGDDYFFSKTFYITGAAEKNWLISKQVSAASANNTPSANIKLFFNDVDGTPNRNKTLLLNVFDGNKRLHKQTLATDANGLLDFNIKTPPNACRLIITAETVTGDKKATIPVSLNRPENTDLQFFPEGGNLVAGLPAQIGFKAIGEDGLGADVSGEITGMDRKPVAEFKSLHNGMGSFNLDLKAGESYTAKVKLPGGIVKQYPLPVVKSSGTVLQVINDPLSDSLQVSVKATPDLMQQPDSYFLIGKARGIVCYAAVVTFRDGHFVDRKMAKALFPAGITHFTLMTAKHQPLNERLVFINRSDISIRVEGNKESFLSGDSVALKIKVTDNAGKPVTGNFSMAVTDNTLIKTDTANSENILSRMLLTSDLKGYVEQPGYYLSKTPEATQALDNLLLTQGWIGYDWNKVFNPPVMAYKPEKDFKVTGRVSNVFNGAIKGTHVLLFSKSPGILMDTTTDKNGNFVFDRFPKVDTPVFFIKAVNKAGRAFNIGIKVDEISPPDFAAKNSVLPAPWYINSDSTLVSYSKKAELKHQLEYYKATGHLLKEVNIRAKKIIKGSQNLNGPGEADQVLDEKDMEKAGKKNLLTLLEENIKGFAEKFPVHRPHWYYINFKAVLVFVDGVYLSDVYESLDFLTFKNYLQEYTAEDIKGVEVMSTAKFAMYYAARLNVNMDGYVFVEISTRSGHGPLIANTPGIYLYKPLPVSIPAQFYKPKYTIKAAVNSLPDLRSTIDWEPNVSTNAKGEASVWFYAGDKPSNYTLIIEGTDRNGNVGYKFSHIKVQVAAGTPSIGK